MAETAQLADLTAPPVAPNDWKSALSLGFMVIAATLFVTGAWAALARIDGAVIAFGTISVESNRKTVQHLEGGIVREILVRDGSVVREGDVLIRLDVTQTQASDTLYRKQLAAALALEARLNAQLTMARDVTFSKEIEDLSSDPTVAQSIADNRKEFESRRDTLLGSLAVIASQEEQARKDIQQTAVQKKTAEDQMVAMEKEMGAVKELLDKGLVSLTRITALQREQIALQGVIDQANVADAKGKARLEELAASSEQLRKQYRQDAATAIPEARKNITDLRQKIIITRDSVQRADVRAPVAGTVQQMRVFTLGGVIKPGEPILDIVPLSDTLIVRAKIAPIDVDRVTIGQEVEIRLPQFRIYQSQVMRGSIRSISQDVIQESNPNVAPYYSAEIAVQRDTIPEDVASKLMAGMNTQVIMPTGERTVLQYLVAPIADQLNASMRER